MTTIPTDATFDPVSDQAQQLFDCVYFFMFAGWETEFRSNRWNFATRWARHLPVILVQPTLGEEQPREVEEPEIRIPNTSILRVRSCPTDVTPVAMHRADSVMVAMQIRRHMDSRGFKKPLLWLYNPWLIRPFLWLPAVFRFMHATEDWPRFPLPDSDSTRLFKTLAMEAVGAADLVVAVSSGVAEGIQSLTTPDRLMTVSNGCDFNFYASSKRPDPEVLAAAAGYERIGIFAGNIGAYFNLHLMREAALKCPSTLFCLFGRESFTDESHADLHQLRACTNVKFFGEVMPERIPSLYAAVHFGLIPYINLENLRKSGFALKVLEMAAAGLPVVSTDMIPMRGLAPSIHVASDEKEFLEHVARIDKRSLTTRESDDLLSVASANDYDLKFTQIFTAIVDRIRARPTGTSIAETLSSSGEDAWISDALRFPADARCSPSHDMIIDLTERYLGQYGPDASDSARVGFFAMQNGITPENGGLPHSILKKMFRELWTNAARAVAESERAEREAKRAVKLTSDLAKAKEKIAGLKARKVRPKKKTLRTRLARLFQSISGRPSEADSDQKPE